MRENSALLLVVLLVFGGVLYPQLTAQLPTGGAPDISAGKSEPHPETPTPGVQSQPPCERDAGQLVAELLDDDAPSRGTRACAIAKDLDFLVATVPDPVDSRVGWLFDQYVDALQRAIEAKGYLIDRYALPWECARQAEKDTTLKQFVRRHEQQPGVVVFRGPGKPLVVLLVGETPTSGIHKAAFGAAVQEITACGQQSVRVVGPSFSGSVYSLNVAVTAAVNSGAVRQFRIISGSATVPGDLASWPNGTTFNGTVVPVSAQSRALYEYLRDHHRARGEEIALLSEANSAYGQRLSPKFYAQAAATPTPAFGPRLVLPFPMHISQVRSAYEHNRSLKNQPSTATGGVAGTSRQSLDLSLDDVGNPRDTLPAMSPALTANYDDLVLADILSTISREGIRYVGLLASDPRDKLFLAQQIRQYCPDVQLFTFGSDLFYAHPKYNDYLNGMIVASTYPLFNQNQLWTGRRDGLRLQFSTNGVEGTYNATILLLSLDATATPRPTPGELFEYAPPFASGPQKPPVWLTVVGHGGMWPVTFLPSYNDHGYVIGPFHSPGGAPVQTQTLSIGFRFSMIIFVLISLFCFANAAAYGWVIIRGSTRDELRERGWIESFRPTRASRYWPQQGVCVGVYFIALFGSYAYLLYLAWAAWGQDPQGALLYERATSLASGVSPLLPVAFVAAAFLLWSLCHLRRLRLLDRAAVGLPFADDRWLGSAGVAALERHLHAVAESAVVGMRARTAAVPLFVCWLIPSWVLWGRLMPTLEGWIFDALFAPLLLLVFLAVVAAFLRFVALWFHFRRLLQRLAMHPMVEAYRRLPIRVSTVMGNQFWSPLPTLADLEPLVQHWLLLANDLSAPTMPCAMAAALQLEAEDPTWRRFGAAIAGAPQVAECFAAEFARVAHHGGGGAVARSETWKRLSAAAPLLVEILERAWRQRPLRHADADDTTAKPERIAAATPTMELYLGATTQPVDRWLRLAEDFVAIQVVLFISYVFGQLRNLLTFVTLALLLMLFTIAAYPFQPQRLLMLVVGGVMVSVVLASLIIFVQIERSDVLSRIANTDPNRVNLHSPFIKGVLTYGVLPIVALVATQFPQLGRFLGLIAQALK